MAVGHQHRPDCRSHRFQAVHEGQVPQLSPLVVEEGEWDKVGAGRGRATEPAETENSKTERDRQGSRTRSCHDVRWIWGCFA
eukprot:1324502-Rhodomonas_salina.4